MSSNPFQVPDPPRCHLCQRQLPMVWEGPTCRGCAEKLSRGLGSRPTFRSFETSSRWPTTGGLLGALAFVLVLVSLALLVYMGAPRW